MSCLIVCYFNLALVVPATDLTGYRGLKTMFRSRRPGQTRIFHMVEELLLDDGYGTMEEARVPMYRYLTDVLKRIGEVLNIRSKLGTHTGRRALFTNIEDNLVPVVARSLGIAPQTARERYGKPGYSSAAVVVKTRVWEPSDLMGFDDESDDHGAYDGQTPMRSVEEAFEELKRWMPTFEVYERSLTTVRRIATRDEREVPPEASVQAEVTGEVKPVTPERIQKEYGENLESAGGLSPYEISVFDDFEDGEGTG